MKITLACVGKIKEKYLAAGIADYTKRLAPYVRLALLSCPEEKMPPEPSPKEKAQVLEREGQRLAALIPPGDYVILLDLGGESLTSPQLAAKLAALELAGCQGLTFVIGGPFGLADSLRRQADLRLSFSAFTFTHQLVRLLLLEQLYRAYKINRGEKYHW